MAWSSIFRIFSSASKAASSASKASSTTFRLGSAFGNGFKAFSTAISNLKWGNVIKIGGVGGITAAIYSTWKSGISTISQATGVNESTIETLIGLAFVILILYIIIRFIIPPRAGSINLNFPDYEHDDYLRRNGGGRYRCSRESFHPC